MSDSHRVVHVAATGVQAHAIRNLLAGYGIAAHVQNDSVASDPYLGNSNSERHAPAVVVPAEEFQRAAEILDDASEAIEQGLASPELTKLEAEIGPDDEWPACPHCERPRLTSCPVCETSGTHFAAAFMPDVPPIDEAEATGQQDALMVLCPTCDEPFAPRFPARCEWCGHRFADGYELPPAPVPVFDPQAAGEFGSRVVIAAIGLAAFMATVFGWFYYVLH